MSPLAWQHWFKETFCISKLKRESRTRCSGNPGYFTTAIVFERPADPENWPVAG